MIWSCINIIAVRRPDLAAPRRARHTRVTCSLFRIMRGASAAAHARHNRGLLRIMRGFRITRVRCCARTTQSRFDIARDRAVRAHTRRTTTTMS